MIHLVNKSKKETFQLPQHPSEIGFDYVSKCVADIDVQEHYCIVALLTTAPLIELVKSTNKGVGSTKSIVVRASYPADNKYRQIPLNRFIYAAPSDLFQGINCNTRVNELSINNIRNFIESDRELSMSIVQGKVFAGAGQSSAASVLRNLNTTDAPKLSIDTTVSKTVCCLDFKIVRITDVIGWNSKEGLYDKGKINGYIVASNLLEIG